MCQPAFPVIVPRLHLPAHAPPRFPLQARRINQLALTLSLTLTLTLSLTLTLTLTLTWCQVEQAAEHCRWCKCRGCLRLADACGDDLWIHRNDPNAANVVYDTQS